MDAVEDDLAEVRLIVDELHAGLATVPYHVFLGVTERADGDDLRTAFHARAQLLHPDQFFELEDTELKQRIYDVYKRVTEAYRVLGDPEARRHYELQRQAGGVRLDKTSRNVPTFKRPEDAVTHPAAKKYFALAVEAERRGDKKGALFNFKLALQMEPANQVLKERIDKLK